MSIVISDEDHDATGGSTECLAGLGAQHVFKAGEGGVVVKRRGGSCDGDVPDV